MSVAAMAEQAFNNYQQAEATRSKNLLQIAGKADRRDFVYGQSIWIIEQNTITELKVYAYGPDRVYACRYNGVRTSVSRQEVIWMNYEAARAALNNNTANKARKTYRADHIRDATKKVDQFREPAEMMQEDGK